MINLVVCEHMICQYGETYVVKESLKEHDAEVRRQTIEEFAKRMIALDPNDEYEVYAINQVAEQMKGEADETD